MSALLHQLPAHPLPPARLERITPQLAEEWLSTMRANRSPSEAVVFKYAIEMDEGRWKVNGETIKFNAKGQLFDGQHRLRACILAGKPFLSLVARGLEEDVFCTVDVGRNRTHADIFSIAGWTQNRNASATASIIYFYSKGMATWKGPTSNRRFKRGTALADKLKTMPTRSESVSRDELLQFAEPLREAITGALRFAERSPAKRLISIPTIAALYYLFRDKSVPEAERFFEDIGSGVGLLRDDPVYVLRERILATKRDDMNMRRWPQIGLCIVVWNKRREGKRCKTLRITDGDAFPKIK